MHDDFRSTYDARREPRTKTPDQFEHDFWARTEELPTGCRIWTGARTDTEPPYGRVSMEGRSAMAHRVSYWMATGVEPGPEQQVDHMCHLTLCVRPSHLDLVTPVENTRRSNGIGAVNGRKTHCKHGHEFTPENTRITRGGKGRDCRTCHRERVRRNSTPGSTELGRLRAMRNAMERLADEWEATDYNLPPGYPMTVNEFCRYWFKAPLRAALARVGAADTQPEGAGLPATMLRPVGCICGGEDGPCVCEPTPTAGGKVDTAPEACHSWHQIDTDGQRYGRVESEANEWEPCADAAPESGEGR